MVHSVKEIFGTAVEIQSIVERNQYLDEACSGNEPLRAEVTELLEAIDRAGGGLLIVSLANVAPTQDIDYEVVPVTMFHVFTGEPFELSGTITTDGTLGPLDPNNIVNYEISVAGSLPYIFSPLNPGSKSEMPIGVVEATSLELLLTGGNSVFYSAFMAGGRSPSCPCWRWYGGWTDDEDECVGSCIGIGGVRFSEDGRCKNRCPTRECNRPRNRRLGALGVWWYGDLYVSRNQ